MELVRTDDHVQPSGSGSKVPASSWRRATKRRAGSLVRRCTVCYVGGPLLFFVGVARVIDERNEMRERR